MFKILSFSKYKALTKYVVDLEEKNKILKELNNNMGNEIKRLEKKLRDYELKRKTEEDFFEYEAVKDLGLELEPNIQNVVMER